MVCHQTHGQPASLSRQVIARLLCDLKEFLKACIGIGTAIYIAPEVLKQKYGLPSDLWSAGIIAYQLVTGRLPFAGEEGEEVSTRFMEKQQFDHKVKPGHHVQLQL